MARQRRWWLILARLTLAGGILGLLFSRIGPARIGAIILSGHPAFLACALVAAGTTRVAAAYRLHKLAEEQAYSIPVGPALKINLAAVFYALFVPGGNVTAAIVRVMKISQTDVPPTAALTVVFRDRLDSTVTLALIGLFFIALDPSMDLHRTTRVLAGVLLAGTLLYLIIFSVGRWTTPWAGEDRGLRFHLRLWRELGRAGRTTASSQVLLLGISVLVHLLGIATYVSLARSLDIGLDVVSLGWIRSAVILLTALPVTLGGLGVRELALLAFIAPYGISRDRIMAFSLLVFFVTTFLFAILGGVLETRQRRPRRRLGA